MIEPPVSILGDCSFPVIWYQAQVLVCKQQSTKQRIFAYTPEIHYIKLVAYTWSNINPAIHPELHSVIGTIKYCLKTSHGIVFTQSAAGLHY